MHTATFTKTLDGFAGNAGLYRMTPPLEGNVWVIASAANDMFSGPETYLFPADKDGAVTDWCELDGSYKGALDHDRAFRNVGYVVKGR